MSETWPVVEYVERSESFTWDGDIDAFRAKLQAALPAEVFAATSVFVAADGVRLMGAVNGAMFEPIRPGTGCLTMGWPEEVVKPAPRTLMDRDRLARLLRESIERRARPEWDVPQPHAATRFLPFRLADGTMLLVDLSAVADDVLAALKEA